MKHYLYLLGTFFVISLLMACQTEKNDTAIVVKTDVKEDSIPSHWTADAMTYALSTEQLLGKNLKEALEKGGVEEALPFCNLNAILLTQSKEEEYKATIKRATDKPRNQDNFANKEELEAIAHFKKQLSEGKTRDEMEPIVDGAGESLHFYYPIITNGMCLQCHGVKEKNVSLETMSALSLLYPDDRALGYEANQVRGVWSVSLRK